MGEMGNRPPPEGGRKKSDGGGLWGVFGRILRSAKVDVNVGLPRSRPSTGSAADPAARMAPVREDRKETYDEMQYRTTEGEDGQAPAVRVDRDRQHIARSIDTRMNASGGQQQIPTGGGAPLPKDVRARMEPKLGASLGDARIHTSGESAGAAESIQAKAFTVGNDVHFGAGQFAPGTKEGDRLLAHELTHVVQGQKSGVQRKAHEHGADGHADDQQVSHPHEPAEKEADAVADHVTDGLHGGGADKHGDKKAAAGQQKAPQIGAKFQGVGRKIMRAATAAAGAQPAPGNKPGKAEDASGPNPNFTADATAFETKLGPLAYSRGAGVGPALIAKVRAYIEAKCKAPILGPMDQLKDQLKDLASSPGFAGGVGTPEDVQQLLMTKEELARARAGAEKMADVKDGNLREQMTIVANFGNLMNKDLTKTTAQDIAKVNEWIAQAGLSKKEIEDRTKRMQKAGPNAPWPEQPAGQVPAGGTPQQQGAQGALSGQQSARLAKNPQVDPTGKVDPRRADRSKEGKPGDPTQTELTPEKMKQQGMPLSDREMRAQGNPGMKDRLKWSEGVKTWMVDKENQWVQTQQKLGIPLGAGPSGTTNMLMNTGQMLGGVDTLALRMACIGYLLPIHAHSLVEILTAAAAHGVPFSPGPAMYRSIPPLNEDELRSCGRAGGKDGKNLFPDEKTPDK